MKLVLFQMAGKRDVVPGVLTERGVVNVADAVPSSYTPQLTMAGIIDHFDTLRPALARLAKDRTALPLSDVQLRAPLPRPGSRRRCRSSSPARATSRSRNRSSASNTGTASGTSSAARESPDNGSQTHTGERSRP